MAQQFDGLAFDTKAQVTGLLAKLGTDVIQVQLVDASALSTNQQLKTVRMFGAGAGHIGIQ